MFGVAKNFIFIVSILIGTIVGAGIFGIPYAISRSGILPGLFYFLILGILVTLIHLFFGEISLRTKGKHRLIGFSRKYLGKRSDIFIAVSVIFGTVGALLAYLILAGDFLKIIFSPWIDLNSFYFTLFFWVILFWFIFWKTKLIPKAELISNGFFFLIILLTLVFALPKVEISNFAFFNSENLFLPFGVLLFSLVGWSAIPEMLEISKGREEKKNLKKAIILTTAVVIFLYLLFTFAVIGVAGRNVSIDAISGLIPFLGGKIIFLGALAGIITLADSFLVLALYLRNTLIYDFKFSPAISSFISGFSPLFLFLIGFRSFIGTIGFVGTIIGAIEGLIIILIFQRAKALGDREPEYNLKVPSFVLYFLMLILVSGAIIQIFI
ncbi:MAG: aromatic amino acid transport family protein [bacterium]|nr:aromatic amino acid transport family protein [bacterium]